MKPSDNSKFKCRACGSIWSTDQVYQDEGSTAVRWTCGNLMCGGTVDEITQLAQDALSAKPDITFEKAMERSLKDNAEVWRKLAEL